jgi:hypothetical protein
MNSQVEGEERMDDAAAAVVAEKLGNASNCNLYGAWQTQEARPAMASGGRVPRNERGNVEVPPFASMPKVSAFHLWCPFGLSPQIHFI